MELHLHPDPPAANAAAARLLASWLADHSVRNLMVAAGNTPLDLYARIAALGLSLPHLNVFMLDEYVGVPPDEPRNCANLLRRTVARAWGIPEERYHTVTSVEADALAVAQRHEQRIAQAGGLDAIILGLGQNGHLGFNEPGSPEHGGAHLLDLQPISIEANRKWFAGDYAPSKGVTVGLRTILAARRVLIMAYGAHKTAAVRAMVAGPRREDCPASLLQGHPQTHLFLDPLAAAGISSQAR
jgi:glucosamine-6-phosphate deaminase